MVVFEALSVVLLPGVVCLIPSAKCSISEPLPVLHQQYQPGDFIVVGILSKIYIFYTCDMQKRPIAAIGGPSFAVGAHLTTILSLYKMPQFIYGSTPETNEKAQAVSYQQMFPNANHQYNGILQLMLHFRWTWIGMVYTNSENGERFVQDVVPMFSLRGICFAFIKPLPAITYSNNVLASVEAGIETFNVVIRSSANVVLIHGDAEDMIILRVIPTISQVEDVPLLAKAKVWVLTAQIQFTSLPFQRHEDIDFLHGALSFAIHSKGVLGFWEFLQMANPTFDRDDSFIKLFWKNAFECSFSSSMTEEKDAVVCSEDVIIKLFWKNAFECSFSSSMTEEKDAVICSGEEKLESLPSSLLEMDMTSPSYSVYNAVFVVAHALHDIQTSILRYVAGDHEAKRNLLKQQLWK
ncbi:vomeronasal type-2 receptor 26-like, partial [Python bivittatus]|uniref:Vomeronasal type-2 receptor 26-like n=1 Tax=Python bivittatus TaxID=176946 RepID=A0A9F5N219_PYTBI